MSHISTVAHISRSAADVFAFVTTPGNWPLWHPSSLAVSGATDHPLIVGEQVKEDYRVAGRRGSTVWTVTEREPPFRWTIVSDPQHPGRAKIRYTLSTSAGGTTFRRDLTYEFANPVLKVLDWALYRRRIRAESETAVGLLKKILEASEEAQR
jgi:hypothetical protein